MNIMVYVYFCNVDWNHVYSIIILPASLDLPDTSSLRLLVPSPLVAVMVTVTS